MSSQANRSTIREEELKAEIRKLAADYRQLSSDMYRSLDKRIKHIIWQIKASKVMEKTDKNSKDGKILQIFIKELDKRIKHIVRQLKASEVMEKTDKNSKDVKILQEIIKELQAKIEAAETMTDLGSGSGSGSNPRKRRRTILKL